MCCGGILAIFWRFLAQVNSVYVLAQRIIWSLVFMGLYLLFTRRGREVAAAFRDRKTMVNCLLCGVLITLNWGMYIYAVNSGHVLQASMGYFIEPVAVGLIGVLAFREKPSPGEKVTFLCAGAGIVFLTVRTGSLPVLALMVAIPFAIYGALKKKNHPDAQTSLFMETLWMTPLALAFSGWWTPTRGHGGCAGGCGPVAAAGQRVVTSVPLLLFNLGVREIPYYFSGILMYINPHPPIPGGPALLWRGAAGGSAYRLCHHLGGHQRHHGGEGAADSPGERRPGRRGRQGGITERAPPLPGSGCPG